MTAQQDTLTRRAPTAPEPTTSGARRRSRSATRTVAIAVAGLAVGIGATVGWSALRSSGSSVDGTTLAGADVTPIDEAALDVPRTPSVGASPEAAVAEFLAAERDGDYRTSFTFLSAADRAALGSEAGWIAAHADLMPPVRDFEIGKVTEAGTGSSIVVADVEFEPSLDEFSGLVPGRALVSWVVTEDGGGWGVELESRAVEPVIPPDGEAVDAVRSWAESRQGCSTGGQREGQWAGQPLGSPALADDLCRSTGAVETGDASPLAPTDATPFVATFGGDVLTYLRAVPISAPVPLRAVVAPIGDRWLVVGVLPG